MDGFSVGTRVKTVDDALQVFQDRDLNSEVKGQVPKSAELQLGATSEVDGREWVDVILPHGISGYALGASIRSHTVRADTAPPDRGVAEPLAANVVGESATWDQRRRRQLHGTTHEGAGAGKAIQDLIVTAFGIVTSGLTALILALVETKLGFAFYSFMWWFVIPVGALLSGFGAASGYYFGARLFHHRPTRLLLFNMISVAITTYFLLNWLNYSFMQVEGVRYLT